MAISLDNAFIIANIKQWLQARFPDMVWENCHAESDQDLVSYRPGVEGTDNHYYIGITKEYSWVVGSPTEQSINRRQTAYGFHSVGFMQLANDIQALQTKYNGTEESD